MPLTTPAPAARTLGGAITRESVGSSSFATGTFAASVTELHLLTPSGAIVAASPSGPHADLFHRIVGREGPSECFIVAARIRLVQAEDFVVTRTVGLPNARDLAAALAVIAHEATWEGQPVQFVEATVRANTYTIALGRAVTGAEAPLHAVSPSHYDRGGPPYAATLSPGASDLLTMTDYLQRWEPDGFWRSFHYGLAHRGVRRAWPARLRTPSVYARLDALMDSPNPAQLLERLARWQPGAPRVFREVAVPLAALGELLESLNGIVREVPLWVTPFATHGDDAGPIPSADPTFWAYCGIWGPGAHQRTGHNVGAENAIDRLTAALGGRTVRFGG
jgi:FAD/FMN-containing dehydrogenase